MSRTNATWAVILITALNLLIVSLSALLGVHGDGSAGDMPRIFVMGALWVMAFSGWGLRLVRKGEHRRGIGVSAKAIPYACAALVLGVCIWGFISITWP